MAYYAVTDDIDLTTKGKRMAAWHFAETSGTGTAQVLLRNGGGSGDIVARINLAISGSKSQTFYSPQYLMFPGGVYVDVVSGTVVGSVDLL